MMCTIKRTYPLLPASANYFIIPSTMRNSCRYLSLTDISAPVYLRSADGSPADHRTPRFCRWAGVAPPRLWCPSFLRCGHALWMRPSSISLPRIVLPLLWVLAVAPAARPSAGCRRQFWLMSQSLWLRRRDLNPRPLGHEPNELPTAPLRNIKQQQANRLTIV